MGSDNIIQFRLRPKKQDSEPMYWMCDCGCATFYRLSDGSLECTRCDHIQTGEDMSNEQG